VLLVFLVGRKCWGFRLFLIYPGRQSGQPSVNGCKISAGSGLLRNSTKIAAQFFGLGQCSQKAPVTGGNLKLRPDCSQRTAPTDSPRSVLNMMIELNLGFGRGEVLRKNQAALSGVAQFGAFCWSGTPEHCSSPNFFAQQKMVELRSSRIGRRSCGLFGHRLWTENGNGKRTTGMADALSGELDGGAAAFSGTGSGW